MSNSINVTVSHDTEAFQHLAKTFPGVKAGFMSRIAESGRLTLKGMLVGGGGLIDLKQYPKSSGGKRTINASVLIRRSQIKFSSFPVNLFENGRKLRSGEKEAPKKIITGKFRSIAESRLQSWADRAEKMVLEEAMKRV